MLVWALADVCAVESVSNQRLNDNTNDNIFMFYAYPTNIALC